MERLTGENPFLVEQKMNLEEITKLSGSLLGWLTAMVGWVIGLIQWRKKRKAEAELKLIRRRGEAHYLIPSNTTFHHLNASLAAGEVRLFPAGAENVLCFAREEVDRKVAQGFPILFVVRNDGQPTRGVSLSLDGAS